VLQALLAKPEGGDMLRGRIVEPLDHSQIDSPHEQRHQRQTRVSRQYSILYKE